MHKSIEKYDDICELKASILRYVSGEIASGFSGDPQEVAVLGEYVDMIKDLAEAEKSCHEACYYESVVEAMEESDMVGGRMGYNPNRNRMGQYSDGRAGERRTQNRSMDGESMRSQSGNRRGGYAPDRYHMRVMNDRIGDDRDVWGDDDEDWDPHHGEAFNRFRKAKRHYTETHSESDRQKMKDHANEHMAETMATLREIWDDSDQDLKKRMKTDLTKFANELVV